LIALEVAETARRHGGTESEHTALRIAGLIAQRRDEE